MSLLLILTYSFISPVAKEKAQIKQNTVLSSSIASHGFVTRISDISSFLKQEQKAIVFIDANWCGPCKIAAPAFAMLADDYKDLDANFGIVDDHEEIASRYNIQSLPTFLVFEYGDLKATIVGPNIAAVRNYITLNW